jgi:glycosyltransferase involved in cell wall biosynthesis
MIGIEQLILEKKPHPLITAIVFTLDEERNLPLVLPFIPDWVDEILMIDGNSTDNTINVARELCPRICILFQKGRGKGDAMKFGFEQAQGDIIVTLDADGATDPRDMSRFVDPLLNGYDFVKGTRLLENSDWQGRWHRWFVNKCFVILTNLLYGSQFSDLCSGYNAFWRNKILSLKFSDNGYENEPLLYIRSMKAGLKISETSFKDHGRFHGMSKELALRQGWITLKTIIRERVIN